MAREMITLRVEAEQLTEIDQAASELGMNRTEYLLKAADLMNQFEKKFTWKKVQEYAKGLNTVDAVVLQNMFIKYLAETQAVKNVYGEYQGIMEEFVTVHDDKGPRMLTGEELYNVLLDSYTRTEKNNKDNHDKKIEYYKNL